MVNATHARPVRVASRDAEGSQEVPLGSLHRIVARDPPLGLAILRGLHDWETSRVVSGVWVTSRHFRPSEWARMQKVGYAGGGGGIEGLWGSMGGGGVSDEEEEGGEGGGGVHHHRAKTTHQPSHNPTPPQHPSKKRSKERFAFESGSDSDGVAIPRGKKPEHPAPPPHGLRRPLPPPNPPTPPPPPRTATAHPAMGYGCVCTTGTVTHKAERQNKSQREKLFSDMS